MAHLFSPPVEKRLVLLDLLLQLEATVQQGLGGGRATGNVNVHGDDPVASTDDGVGVMVVATTVGARAHRNNPLGVSHLIVHLAESGGHLVGQGAGNDEHVSLARRGTENDTEAIEIVTTSPAVHHLHSAARQAEGEGPHGGLTGPVHDRVEFAHHILTSVIQLLLLKKIVHLGVTGRDGSGASGGRSGEVVVRTTALSNSGNGQLVETASRLQGTE